MNGKADVEAVARKLMEDSAQEIAPTEKKRPTRKRTPAKPVLSVVVGGAGNTTSVINGGTHTTYKVEKPPRPKVIVQTGVGVITAAQKRQLLDLRDEVVASSIVRKEPRTPRAIMMALNKHIGVNTYSEIASEDFDKARKFLVNLRAIQHSMPSASKKLPSWRNTRISAIHARSKERGWEAWRKDHMKKKFGKISMIELSDQELEELYRSIMAKK